MVGLKVQVPSPNKSFNNNSLQAGSFCCVPGVLSFSAFFMARPERSPTFKGHHFSSFCAHMGA
jgi:hypothetical protein